MATNKNNTAEKKNEPITEAADLAAENEALRAKLEALMGQKRKEAPAKEGPKMVKVRIPRTKADEEDVFVSVNMRTYQIKRGVEVEVPYFVAEVLRNQERMLEEIMLFNAKVQSK